MGKTRLTLGNVSHCDPFSRMKNTLRQTSYVIPAEIGTPVVVIVVLLNTFEAMFPTLEVRPAPEGPGCSSRFPTTTVRLTGAFAGGETAGVSTASNLLAALHSDQPDCLVYSL